MNRGSRLIAALVVTAFLVLVPSGASAASNDVIRDLDIEITVRPDGMLDVVETYEWDFGSRQGLGFTRILDARFNHDAGMVRVYRYDDFTASSPSGAPAGVWPRTDGPRVRADVGAADGSSDRRSGRQTYVLEYTVEGSLNAIRDQAGVADQEELYWNATGLDWEIPIETASVTVNGPAAIGDHACYQGRRGADDDCDTLSVEGSTVTASTGRLDPGEGLTIMAAFPVGTFGDIAPILEPSTSTDSSNDSAILGITDPIADFMRGNVAWLLPLGVAAPIGFGYRRRRKGRDLHFVGLPPGLLPHQGATPAVAQLSSEPPVAVRFTPPDGLRPAEVGAVHDKDTSAQQVSATIIDLAARGYLRIEETAAAGLLRRTDWVLVATPETAPVERLRDYESLLLKTLFRGRARVKLSSLRNTFGATLKRVQDALADGIDARRLFVKPVPRSSRSGLPIRVLFILVIWLFVGQWLVRGLASTRIGSVMTVLGVAAALLVAFMIAAAITGKARRQRTAAGRALYEQGRGFELYLSTAEGHQLRFEEGEDIFSRYLPYAMVFDVAERWAGIFEQLRQQGYQVAQPRWYAGAHDFDSRSFSNLGTAMSKFSSTASSTLSSTPGSSGGSGSRGGGGGGGSSGGGGGGGGGGGR